MTDATPLASEQIIAAIKARKAIYEQKRDKSDPVADDDSNRHDRMQHTVEAFDYLLHEIAALSATPAPSDQDAGPCVLCFGRCRGHSMGHPDQWVPEPGSQAARDQDASQAQGEGLRRALAASLAKRSVPTMDPVWSAAFNAALDMVARDTGTAPGATAQDGVTTVEACNEAFLDAIHKATPTGQWIAVQHAPDGSGWSVALHPLPWLPGGEVAAKATPTIPAGMVAWNGGDSAPEDWDGGPVYLDWGKGEYETFSDEPQFLGWKHVANPGEDQANIIAYTPLAAAPKQAEQQGVEEAALFQCVHEAMMDERDGKPCGCIIERGCEAAGYCDPESAADSFKADAVVRIAKALTAAAKPMRADDLKAIIRAWLDADDATHWGAFEVALDAAVEGVSERDAVVAMLQSDAETMRQNATAYSEEAPTDARALHEVAATLVFKAAQIKRGDHLAALNAPTGAVEKGEAK